MKKSKFQVGQDVVVTYDATRNNTGWAWDEFVQRGKVLSVGGNHLDGTPSYLVFIEPYRWCCPENWLEAESGPW